MIQKRLSPRLLNIKTKAAVIRPDKSDIRFWLMFPEDDVIMAGIFKA